MYISTRGKDKTSASQAIINGLAKDGGLYIIDKIPSIKVDKDFLYLSYNEKAFKIFRLYLDDFTDEEILYAINKAYNNDNFKNSVSEIKDYDNFSFLNLYQGRTFAFKDVALSILPYFLEISLKKHNNKDKLVILTATSGDTGSAALAGFSNLDNTKVIVLYPNGGVSKIQENQMLSFKSSDMIPIAVNGNFDDCQKIVKEAFKTINIKGINLSSANSINIGRLIPQIVYYFEGYTSLVKKNRIKLGDKINVSVPTGNFGNILACYLAKKMGLPINDIICSSNENDVLTEFLKTNKYDIRREFHLTNSPSMDILVSSNLERYLYLETLDSTYINHLMDDLSSNKYYVNDRFTPKFLPSKTTEEETLSIIKEVLDNYNILIDPHTAVAYGGYKNYPSSLYTMVVSTASPFKFSNAILDSLNLKKSTDEGLNIKLISDKTKTQIDERLNKILNTDKERTTIDKDRVLILIEELLKENKTRIKVPATSANLGSGFDTLGLALDLYNEFEFNVAIKDDLSSFDIKYQTNNLILESYKRFFTEYNLSYIPVKIKLVKQSIPESRGLGSSSSCIIAGLLYARYITKRDILDEELVNLASDIEGHPDNVTPAYYGGLCASYKLSDKSKYIKYDVSKDLSFYVLIPDFTMKTSDSRKVLPSKYTREDVVYNLSRIVNLPYAFNKGDISLIKEVLKDKIHENYRLPLIPNALDTVRHFTNDNSAVVLSGSGSTLLLITKEEINEKEYKGFNIIKTNVNKKGVEIKNV